MAEDSKELVKEEESEDTSSSGSELDFSGHCHDEKDIFAQDKKAQRVLIIVSCLTIVFIALELTGGYIASSLAIMTDAAHMLSDFGGFLISLFAIWMGGRPATRHMSFGYYRAEVLGAVCSILTIWLLTGVLVYLAIDRVINQDYEINADVMLATAGAGICFNLIMGAVLHFMGGGHGHTHGGHQHSHGGGGHSHSESHDQGHGHGHEESDGHQHDKSKDIEMQAIDESGRQRSHSHSEPKQNINVRAAFIHVLGDFVQSIGVFLAALVIKIKPEYHIVDPICTFLFSILVLITTLTVMRDAVHVLMEGTPRHYDYNQIVRDLKSIDGVEAAHNLHIWSITMDKCALAVHLAVAESIDKSHVMTTASTMVRKKYKIKFATIQVESYDAAIMSVCKQCTGPEEKQKETDGLTPDPNAYGTFQK